jgi:hypothetical protein
LPITYQKAAKGLLLSPPNTIHQITEALEQFMVEDAAADHPFIAAMVIRGGQPPWEMEVKGRNYNRNRAILLAQVLAPQPT